VDCSVSHEAAVAFARLAAQEFGVGDSIEANFEKALARADVKEDEANPKSKRGRTSKGAKEAPK
jgi:hypothetical protein